MLVQAALVQAGAALALFGMTGCGIDAVNPVTWYHNLEGGAIARQRPPPPNADAPYPNLGSVPDRPVGSDATARAGIANSLVADRSNAEYAAALAPVPPAASIPTPPPAAAAPPDSSNATLAAASAAPAPPAPATPAPAVSAPPSFGPPPESAAEPAAEPGPAIPDSPPPPPSLPGVIAATTPTPPPKRPPPVVTVAAPVAGAPLAVTFPSGSAILPTEAAGALQALSRQRGGGAVDVVGFGEAKGMAPADQAAALPLALARARAVSNQLVAAGVPPNAIRIDAEASGTGAAARVVR